MSGCAWARARLAVMSPGEIAHRLRIALRDRLAPPAWARWSPAEAGARLFADGGADACFGSTLRNWIHVHGTDDAYAASRAAARALMSCRWRVFGREVALDDPPRWNRNYASGGDWPEAPSAALDHRTGAVAGGPKEAWELGRLTFLPTLALEARLSGVAAPRERAERWLDDFARRNPLGHGIQHASGIEMAIRVVTTSWTLALLGEQAWMEDRDAPMGLLAQQALWCRDHLSLGSSANNHLLAEYAAMAVAGATFPSLRGYDALAREGFAGLEREALRQIHADGVPAEQAFGYLPFAWELLLSAEVAGEASGRPAPDALKARLAASLEFARAIRLPDGRWPQFGDEDDGRILLADETGTRLDVVGNALAAWLGVAGLSDRDQALALLLTGHAAAPAPARDGRSEFPHGGYTVWRQRGLHVTFDHGPLGLGALAAHGHADALSLTVFHDAEGVVIDSGTLAYQDDAVRRERCRSTPAHNTVHFGGRSQSVMLGPFLWGARATVAADGDGWQLWRATHQ